jgi:hypothetical protein
MEEAKAVSKPVDSKPGHKEVKRQGKIGEYIKLIEDKAGCKAGDICKVDHLTSSGNCGVYVIKPDGNKSQCICNKYYVVLEGYQPDSKPEEPKPFKKAKVGDTIKVVKNVGGHVPLIYIGDIQTVESVDNSRFPNVSTKKGNVFYDEDAEYIILKEAPEKPETPETIQVGDTVKVIRDSLTCSVYEEFIKKYASQFIQKYENNYSPENGDLGTVVGIGTRETFKDKAYTVLSNGKVFCMCEKGIEKVR